MGAAYPIGFIGLGTMGEAMALTLVKAGTRLREISKFRSRDRKGAVTKPTAPGFRDGRR